MFEHLDDPNPPQPRALLVEIVVAEGGRRRRRRAAIAGGVAASLLVVAGGIRLAQAAGTGEADVQIETPAGPSSPDSRGEGGGSGDDISTNPGPTDPAGTDAANGEASAPPETSFAATTINQVVLGDTAAGGGIDRVLYTATADDAQLGHQVALSPDRRTVYYVATPANGDEAGESAIFQVSTAGDGAEPELVDVGTHPAVSPDGQQLAYLQDGGTSIAVRDIAGQSPPRLFTGLPSDLTIGDLAYSADSEALVFTAAPPEGPATLHLFELNFSISVSASLADAGDLGPAANAPEGTSSSSPDARRGDDDGAAATSTTDEGSSGGGPADEGTISVVETCCANESVSSTTFVSVDPGSGQREEGAPADGVAGTILRSTYDSSGQNQLVLAVDGATRNLYLGQGDGPLERLGDAPAYTSIDW